MRETLKLLDNYISEAYSPECVNSINRFIEHAYKNTHKYFLSPITYKRYAMQKQLVEFLEKLNITKSTLAITYSDIYTAVKSCTGTTNVDMFNKLKDFDFKYIESIFTDDINLFIDELMDRIAQYNVLQYFQTSAVKYIVQLLAENNLIKRSTFLGLTYNHFLVNNKSMVKKQPEHNYYVFKEIMRQISELDVTCHEVLGTRIVVMDIESTGLLPKNYPIQISLMECDLYLKPLKLETFHVMQDYIESSATKKSHGITIEMLQNMPDLLTQEQAVMQLGSWFTGNKIIVGHSISFDVHGVQLLYAQANGECPPLNTLCTLKSKGRLNYAHGSPKDYKNESLAKYYNDEELINSLYTLFKIPTRLKTHDSTHDIFLTYSILKHNQQLIRA